MVSPGELGAAQRAVRDVFVKTELKEYVARLVERTRSHPEIALGSSTQVALLVAPLLVFAGVLLGRNMNLVFTPFEVVSLALATIVTAIITLDGESHWFEGVQLLAVYGMMAVGAFFLV